MTRIPTAARKGRAGDDDHPEPPRERLSLATHVLREVEPPRLGRPPESEEEKRAVLQALAYYKSSGRTRDECAALLDVSPRTIGNYLKDVLYTEICAQMEAEAVSQGHTTIALLVEDAITTLYGLMHSAKSEFVVYKAAEQLLKVAGFEEPRAGALRDSREEVERYLREVQKRQGNAGVQVNVQVNTSDGSGAAPVVIEAARAPEHDEDPLALYRQIVAPGGILPGSRIPRLSAEGEEEENPIGD